jgi:hypothetical protein
MRVKRKVKMIPSSMMEKEEYYVRVQTANSVLSNLKQGYQQSSTSVICLFGR